jgi:hypothetical protein
MTRCPCHKPVSSSKARTWTADEAKSLATSLRHAPPSPLRPLTHSLTHSPTHALTHPLTHLQHTRPVGLQHHAAKKACAHGSKLFNQDARPPQSSQIQRCEPCPPMTRHPQTVAAHTPTSLRWSEWASQPSLAQIRRPPIQPLQEPTRTHLPSSPGAYPWACPAPLRPAYKRTRGLGWRPRPRTTRGAACHHTLPSPLAPGCVSMPDAAVGKAMGNALVVILRAGTRRRACEARKT